LKARITPVKITSHYSDGPPVDEFTHISRLLVKKMMGIPAIIMVLGKEMSDARRVTANTIHAAIPNRE
jgi:hypothetical protein